MVYDICINCSVGNYGGRIEIDHGLAPGAVDGPATTQEWGSVPTRVGWRA